MAIPPDFVDGAVGDLTRRCELVIKAKGGHFEEAKAKPAKALKRTIKKVPKKK